MRFTYLSENGCIPLVHQVVYNLGGGESWSTFTDPVHLKLLFVLRARALACMGNMIQNFPVETVISASSTIWNTLSTLFKLIDLEAGSFSLASSDGESSSVSM